MNKTEIGKLLAYVAGACPSQKMNDLTGDAWHDILGHLDYDECRAAARVVGAKQPYIAPSDIIAAVAEHRSPEAPHSNACRGHDHRNCSMTWCMCVCHPKAVQQLAGPPAYEAGVVALPAGPRRYDPSKLAIGRPLDE